MQVEITIEMDNSTFDDNNTAEVCRILKEHISKVAKGGELYEGHFDSLLDINGNCVGHFSVNP